MRLTKQVVEVIREKANSRKLCTDAALSKFTGVPHSTMNRIMNMQVDTISDVTVSLLCRKLGIPIPDMLILSMGRVPLSRDAFDDNSREAFLARWLLTAPEKGRELVFKSAEAFGFPEE